MLAVITQKEGLKKDTVYFHMYAIYVCCSQCYQCIIQVICYMFYWHRQFFVRLPNQSGETHFRSFFISSPHVTALKVTVQNVRTDQKLKKCLM